MKKVVAWLFIILFYAGTLVITFLNIRNAGWYFVATMVGAVLIVCLFFWAIKIIKE